VREDRARPDAVHDLTGTSKVVKINCALSNSFSNCIKKAAVAMEQYCSFLVLRGSQIN
jgi:hypothetical protein